MASSTDDFYKSLRQSDDGSLVLVKVQLAGERYTGHLVTSSDYKAYLNGLGITHALLPSTCLFLRSSTGQVWCIPFDKIQALLVVSQGDSDESIPEPRSYTARIP